jgi:tRNA(Ile)-lysidine synthase
LAQRLNIVEEKFLNTIKKYNLIKTNDVIVVGVSGGPDSITLLTCLDKYKDKFQYKLVVAHINHLIRKDSTEDEQFVENLCEKLNIPCEVKRANVAEIAKEEKRGEEEVGRKIRYDFFDEVAKKYDANKIAIAHNMNDNAETVLLNLIRGSGLSGLEGIQPQEYGKYIRPLIECSRDEIEKYCEENDLKPRIDSTNSEDIYKRNEIRHKVLPMLKEFNPNIVETLSRTSKIVKENNDFVTQESAKTYTKIAKKEGKNLVNFELTEFNKLENSIRTNLIIYTINDLLGSVKDISKVNIDDVIELANNNVGNKYIFIKKNLKVSVNKGLISFEVIVLK